MKFLSILEIWGGAIAIASVQVFGFFVQPFPSIYFPTPVYLLVSVMFMFLAFPFILPSLYALVCLRGFKRKNIGKVLLLVACILSTLDVLWILTSWEYGEKYQGSQHARIVAIENAVGFCLLIGMTLIGHLRNSERTLRFSNLLLFFLLAWCAFPCFGELP